MSSSSNGSVKPAYEPVLNAEEVYCVLLHKLDAEYAKFNEHIKKAENTVVDDALEAQDSNPAKTIQKFKSSVYKALKEEFENLQASSFHSLDMFLEERVTKSFKEHTDRNDAVLRYLENELKATQTKTNLLCDQARDLESNLLEKKTKEKMSKEELNACFERKQNLLGMKHRKLVRGVRSVTATIFPQQHRELNNILGILLEKSFTNDAYVVEEDGWEELVEFLLRTEIVVRHPDNRRKIRLVDYM